MKQHQKTLVCLLLALGLPTLAQAQSKLILPQSQKDIRQLTQKENSGPCEKCGIVTNVRSETRQRQSREAAAPPTSSGIGGNIATTPIIGSGTAVKDARNATKPMTFYKMTVRFDDGTYAFFEQDDEPAVHKGDRVEVIDGRLEPRSN